MKRLLPLALLLSGCATLPSLPAVPATPATVADRTLLDEKAAIAVTVGYTAASRLGNRLARAGIIPLARFQAADRAAFAALKGVRAAYEAGNADSYTAALANANRAIDAIKELV